MAQGVESLRTETWPVTETALAAQLEESEGVNCAIHTTDVAAANSDTFANRVWSLLAIRDYSPLVQTYRTRGKISLTRKRQCTCISVRIFCGRVAWNQQVPEKFADR